MIKKIGIIGGAGFIGQNLTHYFIENGYRVKVIGRKIDPAKFQHELVTTVEVDVFATELLTEHVKDCDTVIWLVSATVPSTHVNSLVDDFNINLQPIIRFLEQVAKLPELKRFVYLSSGGTIYGDSTDRKPFAENNAKKPISAYGLSKIIAEEYITYLTHDQSFQSFILRPSNVYGLHQNLLKPQGIIGYAFKAIINNSSIDLYDDGRVTRDFIYVTDVAKAIQRCIERDLESGTTSIYNIGSQKGFTIKEILEKINTIAATRIQVIPKSSRNFDCNYNVLDIEKVRQELNWEPDIDIDEGLERVWNWIKNENK